MSNENSSAPLKTAGEPFIALGECIADQVCLSVAELPDRDSPADWPQAMLVTSDELRNIVLNAINYAAQAVAAQAPAAVAVPDHVYTLRVNGRLHDYTPMLIAFNLSDGEHKLYTEQQVRDLIKALPATEYSSAGDLAAVVPTREFICPTKTVADLVNNLLLLDQSLPVYGAQYIDHPVRKRCAIAVDPTISRERVKDGRWIGQGDELNAVVIWTRAAQPAQAEVQAEPGMFINPKVIDKSTGKIATGTGALTHADSKYGGWTFPVYAAPQAQPADALDAEVAKKAARYDWMRRQFSVSPNRLGATPLRCVAIATTFDDVTAEVTDSTIDAAMAAAQEGGKAAKEA